MIPHDDNEDDREDEDGDEQDEDDDEWWWWSVYHSFSFFLSDNYMESRRWSVYHTNYLINKLISPTTVGN